MVTLTFDQQSWAFIDRVSQSTAEWEDLLHNKTAETVAEMAESYMKPLMHVRPQITGSAEDNLRNVREFNGNGFTISFYSNWYINYVDEGSPFNKLYAKDYEKTRGKGFPVDKRFGHTDRYQVISGIGQGNSPYASQLPAHFSERTAEYLETEAANVALANMVEWLDWVVMR